jgi:hypothetical protein
MSVPNLLSVIDEATDFGASPLNFSGSHYNFCGSSFYANIGKQLKYF